MARTGINIFDISLIIFIGYCVAERFDDYENVNFLTIDPTDLSYDKLIEMVNVLRKQLKITKILLNDCRVMNRKKRIDLIRDTNSRRSNKLTRFEKCSTSESDNSLNTGIQSFRRNQDFNNRYSVFGKEIVGAELGGWLDSNIISSIGQLFDPKIKEEANRERIEREKLREKELQEKYTNILNDPLQLIKLREESDKAPKIINQVVRRRFNPRKEGRAVTYQSIDKEESLNSTKSFE